MSVCLSVRASVHMYVCMHVCMGLEGLPSGRGQGRGIDMVREMGGDPRTLVTGNHLLLWIAESSGCHCTDAFGAANIVECRPLRSTSPFSDV